jgi:hypothetical protein
MSRIILTILVLAIGYDAVVHQGAYTRSAWSSLVGLTDSAITGAKQIGERARDETRSQN